MEWCAGEGGPLFNRRGMPWIMLAGRGTAAAAGSGARATGEDALAGQDGVSGFVGPAGHRGGICQGQGPDTFRADGPSCEEAGLVQGMSPHGEEALVSGVKVKATDVAAAPAFTSTGAQVARGRASWSRRRAGQTAC